VLAGLVLASIVFYFGGCKATRNRMMAAKTVREPHPPEKPKKKKKQQAGDVNEGGGDGQAKEDGGVDDHAKNDGAKKNKKK